MSVELISSNHSFGGSQSVYSHESLETATTMRFAVYLPPQAKQAQVPVLYWLSGLTCTEENFIVKAGAQRIAAELGVAIIAPDTSPRGLGYAGEDDAYDFGTGAGFYVDATNKPWADGYRMYSYVSKELPALIEKNFSVDGQRSAIFGHSMGGHGALSIALKHPEKFKSVSAFAPICSPTQCSWGQKLLEGYLGADQSGWSQYDSCALIGAMGWSGPAILVDQGGADEFLLEQLKPDLLRQACDRAGVPLQLNVRENYDHSYFFIASFMEDHVRYHAKNLGL